MSDITPDVVRHVALLSRLELSEGEAEKYAAEIDTILHHVEQLKELDTTNIPPTSHSFKQVNVFREDELRDSLNNESAIANAPESDEHCFKVPAVLAESGGA